MMPRLGEKYRDIEIEVTPKRVAGYRNHETFEPELPVGPYIPAAPAIMVGDEIVVEGEDVSQDEVETVIRRYLGMDVPDQSKKGILSRLFGM